MQSFLVVYDEFLVGDSDNCSYYRLQNISIIYTNAFLKWYYYMYLQYQLVKSVLHNWKHTYFHKKRSAWLLCGYCWISK